jgi:hypothetical protein
MANSFPVAPKDVLEEHLQRRDGDAHAGLSVVTSADFSIVAADLLAVHP